MHILSYKLGTGSALPFLLKTISVNTGANLEHGWSIDVDPVSKNFSVAGETGTSTVGRSYVRQYDTNGNTLWQRESTEANTGFETVKHAPDGSVYAAGGINERIVKFNSSGVPQWHRRLQNNGNVVYGGVELDSAGNVYALSNALGSVYLEKYNSSGSRQWARKIDGTNSTIIPLTGDRPIAVDSNDNVIIALMTWDGEYPGLIKFNSSGTVQWQRSYSFASLGTSIRALVVDSSDDIYWLGTLSSGYAILTKHDGTTGNRIWSNRITGASDHYGLSTNVVSGDLYLTGTTNNERDATITAVNSSGSILWHNILTQTEAFSFDLIYAVKYDAGNLYVTGRTQMVSPSDQYRILVARVRADGTDVPGSVTDGTHTFTYTTSSATSSTATALTEHLTELTITTTNPTLDTATSTFNAVSFPDVDFT